MLHLGILYFILLSAFLICCWMFAFYFYRKTLSKFFRESSVVFLLLALKTVLISALLYAKANLYFESTLQLVLYSLGGSFSYLIVFFLPFAADTLLERPSPLFRIVLRFCFILTIGIILIPYFMKLMFPGEPFYFDWGILPLLMQIFILLGTGIYTVFHFRRISPASRRLSVMVLITAAVFAVDYSLLSWQISNRILTAAWIVIGLLYLTLGLVLLFSVLRIRNQPEAALLVEGIPGSFAERFDLSSREMEITALLIQGLSNLEISGKLFISVKTVKNHITRIFQKTSCKNRIELARKIKY